jgi:hypothetical protein
VGLAAAPAGAADRVVIGLPRANVDAFVGTFAWFGDGRLVLFSRGRTRFASVKRFRGVSSLNLGPGRSGSPVAAYSRCKGSAFEGGCDLFALGLRSGREHKLRSLSTRKWSEYTVAVWGRRYLFARRLCPRRFECRPSGLFVSAPLRRISRADVGEVDLRGRVAAFTVMGKDTGLGPDSIRVVHLSRRRGGRQCVVAVVMPVGTDNAFWSPVVTRRFVYWAASGTEGATEILRRRIPSRRCGQRGPVQRLRVTNEIGDDVAVTQGRVFYTALEPPNSGQTSLFQMTDPLVRDP